MRMVSSTMMSKVLVIKTLFLFQCRYSAAFVGPKRPAALQLRERIISDVSTTNDKRRRTQLDYSQSPYRDGEQKSSSDTSLRVASIESAGENMIPVLGNQTTLFYDLAAAIVPTEDAIIANSATKESDQSSKNSMIEDILSSYWGPRILLAAVACLYGTNFPLGSIMDHALPPSAATSARFVLASLALSPFIFRLHKDLIPLCLFAGCFTGMGYVTQSLALADTSPATVSFLGAATVIWCPFLEWLVDKKPMGIKDRPQTWIAASLCLLGVGVLELCGGDVTSGTSVISGIGMGDVLAVMQAIGFGTGIFLSEKMMKRYDNQALPITSVLVATTALISMVWALTDGWMGTVSGWESMTLPNLLLDPSMREVAFAVVWTGLLSTSLNFFIEITGIGKVPSGEASVILATEPLWAAAFAALILGESFGWNDYTGGFLIVAACLVNTLKTKDVKQFLFGEQEGK